MAFVTEMFLDNNMIEMSPSVSRRLHPAEKHILNPIVQPERWWEGNQMLPYATMYDEDEKIFKMWLRCGSDAASRYVDGHAAYMTYLTSTDGVHWDRPELGALDFGGRRDHNVIFTGGEAGYMVYQGKKAMLLSVIKHPKPTDEAEKYISLIYNMKKPGLYLGRSPDGINWQSEPEPFWRTPIDVAGCGDDATNQMFYDKAKEKWVVCRRIVPEENVRMVGTDSDRDWRLGDRYYRVYAYAESDDLKEWKNFQPMLSMDADDPGDTELYYFAAHNYGQAYIGYMSVYHLTYPRPSGGSIDVQLATSRDGINWTRVRRGEPFIPCGAFNYYDYMVMVGSQAEPVIFDDTVYIYYEACNFPHDVEYIPDQGQRTTVGLATLKRDRFASLETCDPEPSRLVTKPFIVDHPKLFLNAATWEKGWIRVEAMTRDWQPIAGFTEPEAQAIQGDALDHPARWKDNADLGKLMGKEIRLKFYMSRARIHAMTLDDDDRELGQVSTGDHYALGQSPTMI